MSRQQTWLRVWVLPLTIGAACAFGLCVALVSDGLGDVLAWMGLGAPVVISGRALLR